MIKTLKENNIFLIDSNVILDVLLEQDNAYSQWSVDVLMNCSQKGFPAINQIIYAEISSIFPDIEDFEKAIAGYSRLSLPWEAGFIAGKAFLAYRKNGGKRQTLMPDFYIGAHAAFSRLTLVSRDRGYKHYFPKLNLIAPPDQL